MSVMPSEDSRLLHEAISAARRGDRLAAEGLLRKASEIQPNNELVWLWLSHLAQSARERIPYLREARRSNPAHPQAKSDLTKALLASGIEAAKAGARETARQMLEEALTLDPRAEQGWLWLAGVLQERGAQKRCLLRVLEINPAHPHARALLQRPELRDEPPARCPICGGERQEANDRCPTCRAVLALTDLAAVLGNTLVEEEIVNQAIRAGEDPASPGGRGEAHFALALAHLNLGRLEPGLYHLKALSAARPADKILKSQIEILALWQQTHGNKPAGSPPVAAPSAEPRPAEPASPGEAVPVATLLVIDDSATVRKIVTSTLVGHGYRVIAAGDAIEGLSKLREHKVGLVLLDINLPGIDGYQVCKVIKADPATAHVPVVMLSGRGGLFDRMRGRKVGSSGHMSKPFEPRALVELVQKTCLTGANFS